MAKIKSVGTVKDFMVRGQVKKYAPYGLIPLAVAPWLAGSKAFASDGGAVMALTSTTTANTVSIYERMIHAFDPLIDLIQALAYPVAMIVVLGGALFIMIGNKEKGFAMMQGAGLGYVLVQLMPMVLNILVEAMKGAI